MKRIALLHYASPPTVGGVESVIARQARGLADLNYPVRIITGSGAAFDPRIETRVEPLFGSRHADVLRVKQELDGGIVSPAYEALVNHLAATLAGMLADCAACIVHNVHTMNKNLPLTAALARVQAAYPALRMIAWCHDLAWTNPQYLPELHPGEPWDLLRQVWANTVYVTVSEPRRVELADLLHLSPDQIHVITAGVDPAEFFQWTATTRQLEATYRLLDSDGILLLPARLTRRKNIALALHILAAMRAQSAADYRLIVTGPPGPHNPANPGYLGELLDLRGQLRLQDAAHFLYEMTDPPLIPDDTTMANLYQLADALLFTSEQEGFGIPLLEAGLTGLPVFCSDIPPFRQTGQADVSYFELDAPPQAIATQVLTGLTASGSARLRVRVRQQYRWQRIIEDQLLPLLETP